MMEIFAYTDGSAVSNGKNKGKGGFAAYFPNLFGKKKAYSLGFKNAKTGQMEVMALLYAIKAMPKNLVEQKILKVYSDSEYVVKTFTEHRLERWRKGNWTSYGKEIANKELWIQIYSELKKRNYMTFRIEHIKSHQLEKEKDPEKLKQLQNNPHIVGNNIADKLADYKRHKKLL